MLCVAFSFSQSINSAEYFFDTDPGIGNGMSLPTDANTGELSQTYMIDISSLSNGFHDLYIRTSNNENNWSHYDRSTFYISTFNTGQNIVAAEYFYDIDEGVGEGETLDVNPEIPNISQSFLIPTTGLLEGFHSLYIRTQLADGSWGLYDRQIIYIKEFANATSQVVSAEYYIDEDPGVGLGESLSITSPSQVISFDTVGLAEGDHLFCIRVQNADLSWSLYDCEIFTIGILSVEDSLFQSTTISPNPFVNEVKINSSKQLDIKLITVYDITGKKVYSSSENLSKVNLSSLENGIYIMHIKTETQNASFKIIKQ